MNPLKRKIFRFRGVPRENQPDKPSKWRRFLNTTIPWLNYKKEQGETYLQAVVEKERATAVDTYASAEVKFAQAEKIKAETEILRLQAKEMTENAARKEEELLNESNQELNLEEEFTDFAEFLRILHLKYGTKVSIKLATNENGEAGARILYEGKEVFVSGTSSVDKTIVIRPEDQLYDIDLNLNIDTNTE